MSKKRASKKKSRPDRPTFFEMFGAPDPARTDGPITAATAY
ncbi:MAG: hypothetical protein QNL11_07770 [Desulfobacterales bacterium]|nr:hypothetical protein [Desulfobacterales bacterium]